MNEDDDELDSTGFPREQRARRSTEGARHPSDRRQSALVVGTRVGKRQQPESELPEPRRPIFDTYAAGSRATAKHKLYDSYLRAIRWASDRIGTNGIVAFVSNGSFLEGNSTDGVRKSIAAEFNKILRRQSSRQPADSWRTITQRRRQGIRKRQPRNGRALRTCEELQGSTSGPDFLPRHRGLSDPRPEVEGASQSALHRERRLVLDYSERER